MYSRAINYNFNEKCIPGQPKPDTSHATKARVTAGNPRTLIKSQLGYSFSYNRQHFPQQMQIVTEKEVDKNKHTYVYVIYYENIALTN